MYPPGGPAIIILIKRGVKLDDDDLQKKYCLKRLFDDVGEGGVVSRDGVPVAIIREQPVPLLFL